MNRIMNTEVRLMRDEEFGAVEAIYTKVFGMRGLEYWRRRYEWQFRKNPAASYRPSLMWVGVKDETVLAFLASFPARLKVLDKELTILCPCDLMVSPDARAPLERLGERLLRLYASEAGGLANAFAYSRGAERIYDRLGYRSVFIEPSLLRPLRGNQFIKRMVEKRLESASLVGNTLRALTPVISGGAGAIITVLNAIRSPRRPNNLCIDVNPAFNADFDRLWRESSREIPIAFVRDARTLQWRFREDPITHHTVFAARRPSGALAGYAVACESNRPNLRTGKIMDLFCPPSLAKEVVGALASSFLRYFRSLGIDIVITKGLHPIIRKELRRYMYLKFPGREIPARLLLGKNRKLTEAVYVADNWHLSHSDGDEDFVP